LGAQSLVTLAGHLGAVEIYAALAPLERLITHEDALVRGACLRAAKQLFFKRTFVLVGKGLKDPEAQVRQEALGAVARLHFAHAFDPLARIFRESTDREVRKVALGSIGRISSLEALDLLVEALRHGDDEERPYAAKLLVEHDHVDVDAVVRRLVTEESGRTRALAQEILRGRTQGMR